MAITIQQTPTNYSPAFNPIWWVVSSTNTAQTNFEYICDVYITGVTFAGGASYLRLKVPADPTYGRGAFNIAPILQRQLTGDLGDTIYGFQQCSNSILDYDVKFGELYGPSSGVTAYPSLTNSTGRTAFNGSLSSLEFKDYTLAGYSANTNATQINLLSNAPSSGSISTGFSQWIYAMSQTSGAIKFANINLYNTAGSLSGTVIVINHQYHNTSTAANRMLRFPAGYNISLISASDIVSNNLGQPISVFLNTTTNAKWEIYFTDSAHNRITKSYYSSWDTACTGHTVYQLYFKNKYGAYDTFDFIRASQVSTDIKREKYQKVMGEFKSGSSYTYNDFDRFETNFYSTYKETIKLNSDWITENESIWLQEMFSSPDIRIDLSPPTQNHYLVPVNIIDTNYTQRQHKTDKVFNIEVSVQTTYKENRQGA